MTRNPRPIDTTIVTAGETVEATNLQKITLDDFQRVEGEEVPSYRARIALFPKNEMEPVTVTDEEPGVILN